MRIVQVQTVSVTSCAACGDDHAHIELLDVYDGPGIIGDPDPPHQKAILCPRTRAVVILLENHIEDADAEAVSGYEPPADRLGGTGGRGNSA
jgi:hypothetical protein